MATRTTGMAIRVAIVAVIVLTAAVGGAVAASADEGLPTVLNALEEAAVSLSDNQITVLNLWRPEVLGAPNLETLELRLQQLELDNTLAPVLALPQTLESIIEDGYFQRLDLVKFALRLALRNDHQRLLTDLELIRSEYLKKMPRFQELDAGVTPALVLAMLVTMDTKLAAESNITETTFENKMVNIFINLLIEARYSPVLNAIIKEMNDQKISFIQLAANPGVLPEFSLIRATLHDNRLPGFSSPAGRVVTGRVRLQGRLQGEAIAVVPAVEQHIAQTDSAGVYVLSWLETGPVTKLRYQRRGYLSREIEISDQASRTYLPLVTLLAGDLDQDGLVGVGDLRRLAAAMDSRAGGGNNLMDADYDGSGRVDLLDWTIMVRNIGKQ